MNKTKFVVGITVMALATSLIVACGSKGEPQEQEPAPTPVEVAVAPEQEQPPAEAIPVTETTEPPTETEATPAPDIDAILPGTETMVEPVAQATEPEVVEEAAAPLEPPPFVEMPKAKPPKRKPVPSPAVKAPESTKPTPEEIVARILDSMQWGAIDLKTPATMKREDKATAQLVVDTSGAWQNMKKTIENEAVKNGLRMSFATQLNAELSSTGFQIASIVPETQSMVSPGKLDWQWDIKPNAAGKQNVHLALKVSVSADGSATDSRTIKTLDKTIDVTEAPAKAETNMLSSWWPWLIGVVLVIIIAVIAVRKFGNKA